MIKYILYFFLLLLTTSFANAKECDLKIKDGSAALDLNKALNCLHKEIISNKMEIKELKEKLRSGTKVEDPYSSETDSVILTFRSGGKKENCLNVGLSLKNKTTEKIFVATDLHQITLVDGESGEGYSVYTQNGIKYVTGNKETDKEKYTPINPNSHINFNLKFCSKNIKSSKSTLNSLGFYLMTLDNEEVKKDSLPLQIKMK